MLADRRILVVLNNQSNFFDFEETCSYWSGVFFSLFFIGQFNFPLLFIGHLLD